MAKEKGKGGRNCVEEMAARRRDGQGRQGERGSVKKGEEELEQKS